MVSGVYIMQQGQKKQYFLFLFWTLDHFQTFKKMVRGSDFGHCILYTPVLKLHLKVVNTIMGNDVLHEYNVLYQYGNKQRIFHIDK